jgi:2-deoxy-D-gluconate 3-dehydrogenase
MPNFDLSQRAAFVTGGNGGIGLGMARGLAEAGATVVIAGRNRAKAETALAELRAIGEADFVELDVLDEASCRKAIDDTAARFDRLDILVNNAGTTVRKQPQDLSVEEWRRVMDTNLTSAFVCAQAAYPRMKRGGGGKIINIGSMMSIFASSFATPYAASKGGIVQMARALAVAWAKDNIQVNCILPGWIDTDLTKTARAQVPGLNERVLERTPTGR